MGIWHARGEENNEFLMMFIYQKKEYVFLQDKKRRNLFIFFSP
jgi:hypothetical protein